jgi:CHAD domain-containing protein
MRLAPGEPLDAGLRRVALEQLEVMAQGFSLPADDTGSGDRIHRARKASKRVRSLLRLVRADIGEEVYCNENVVIRDQAKRLSDLRIAYVLIETIDQQAADTPESAAGAAAELRPGLVARRDALIAGFRSDADGRAAARTAIACARARIERWPGFDDRDEPNGSLRLVPGLVHAYERGRRGMRTARNSKTAVDFHDWRKRVNYLRYQIEALQERLPANLEESEQPLNELSETLGAEHDLVDLARVIEAEASPGASGDNRAALLAAIQQRRHDLQLAALRAGKTFYRERPNRVAAALTAYWATD